MVILLFLDLLCPSPECWVALALNARVINGDLKPLIVEFFSHVSRTRMWLGFGSSGSLFAR